MWFVFYCGTAHYAPFFHSPDGDLIPLQLAYISMSGHKKTDDFASCLTQTYLSCFDYLSCIVAIKSKLGLPECAAHPRHMDLNFSTYIVVLAT